MIKKISILGSTGSIGLSVLKIIEKKKKIFFKINLLSANQNFKLICKQIEKYKPKYFLINDPKIYLKVKKYLKKNIKILNSINNKKLKKSDISVSAISGIAGLKPTISIISSTKKLLIANKESIICGWNLIKKESLKNKTEIIPVDSEHFSILKLVENQNFDYVKKIYLTASGGPFLNFSYKQLKKVKPKHAIAHPRWNMGKNFN